MFVLGSAQKRLTLEVCGRAGRHCDQVRLFAYVEAVAPTIKMAYYKHTAVKAGQLPAATVARTVYHGPYEGRGATWAEFLAWVAAEG